MKLDAGLMGDAQGVGDAAAALEAAGYDGIYAFEGVSDPFLRLALAAPRSRQAELITAIAVAFARSPMTTAQMAWDLHGLSGGRFILGVGTQVKAHIERRFSMPWSQPAARMREYVEALRHIWNAWETGAPLSFEGSFYRHTLSSPMFTPPPTKLGPIPIYLAAVGPLMTQVAGEVADGVFIHPFHSAKSLAELTLPNLALGASRAGRTDQPIVSAQVITAMASDGRGLEPAVAAARQQIGFYGSTPAYRPVLELHGWGDLQPLLADTVRQGRWQDLGALVTDEMLETFAVVGAPAEVAAKIRVRCEGVVDRVSPIVYPASTAHYVSLAAALRG